jgi:hypothetical protein
MFGVATIGGRRMTIDEVRDKVAGTDQADVQLNDPTPEMDRRRRARRPGRHPPGGHPRIRLRVSVGGARPDRSRGGRHAWDQRARRGRRRRRRVGRPAG